MRKNTFLTMLILFTALSSAPAQKKDGKYFKPDFILVQLRSEQNRQQAASNAGDSITYKQIKNEADQVRQLMIADFKKHFTFCPAYFFIDTNINRIKNQQFDGILTDVNGRVVTAALSSQQYYITYYGYPVDDTGVGIKVRPGGYVYNNSERSGKGFVMMDKNFRSMHTSGISSFPYFTYRIGYWDLFKKKKYKAYYFNSKRFDISYAPLALPLSNRLKEYYGM